MSVIFDNRNSTAPDWGAFTTTGWRAQSFTIADSYVFTSAQIYGAKQSGATGLIYMEIYNDSSGKPGSSLVASDHTSISTWTTDPTWSDSPVITFTTQYTGSASTTYWAVMKSEGTAGNGSNWVMRTGSGGQHSEDSGANWASQGSFAFEFVLNGNLATTSSLLPRRMRMGVGT